MITTDRSAITETECREIAAALGEGWTVEPVTSGHRAATLTGPDSQALTLCVDWRHTDRLEIRGDIPTPYDRRQYDYRPAEITVSRDKGAAKIAADITRRLLPDYLPKLAASLEVERAHSEYVDSVTNTAGYLETAAGRVLSPMTHRSSETSKEYSLRLSHGYGNATVRADSVSLELNGITPDQARRILAIVGE